MTIYSESDIKKEIWELTKLRKYQGRLRPARGNSPFEFPFKAGVSHFRADLAFCSQGGDWIFIEPDDAKRSPSNVTKYWMWIEEGQIKERVYLIHPIGPGDDSQRELAKFIGGRLAGVCGLHYYQYDVLDWNNKDWLAQMDNLLSRILNIETA